MLKIREISIFTCLRRTVFGATCRNEVLTFVLKLCAASLKILRIFSASGPGVSFSSPYYGLIPDDLRSLKTRWK